MHNISYFDFSDKVIVVTGAAGILGSALSRSFVLSGAQVMCLDCCEEKLCSMVTALQNELGKTDIEAIPCDVSDETAVKKAVAYIMLKQKKIDVLVNNAATKTNNLKDFFTKFEDYSLSVWKNVMAVNLEGMFLMTKEIGPYMQEQKNGCIIQIASIYSLLGPDQRIYEGSEYLGLEINTPAVYTTSKAGVVGLTKHLATLWGRYNIRVNAICPGGIESGQNDLFAKRYSDRIPLGRMASKEDIIGPILFLSSDAAKYVSGQVLYVDGGLSAW